MHLHKYEVPLHVNGETHLVSIRASDTLLNILRRELALTGAKPGCLNGDCGACTIMIDQIPYKSCIFLAIEAIGAEIMTIEGLVDTPIQKAFIEQFAFQCGYCTPGFIMNIHALLQKHGKPEEKTIVEWLSSNICRCTGYQEIENAVKSIINSNSR